MGLTGCVERKMVVRSEPPGAEVYLEGRRLPPASAPASSQAAGDDADADARPGEAREVPFVFYGTRHVTLIDPDHRPASRVVPLRLPWYQWPILDLVSEFCIPWTIHDVHEVTVRREPWGDPEDWDEDALLRRAEAFRGLP